MTLRDALLKIQKYTNEYFLHLIGELSNLTIFAEPDQFVAREKYRGILDSIALSPEFCQRYIGPKELSHLAKDKYALLNKLAQAILQTNILNLSFYSASNVCQEKELIDTVCEAHARAANNYYPQQLFNELKRAASLYQIIFEVPPSNNQAILSILTRYKEALREGHLEVRDFFSNIVLSILHPLFVLPELNINYALNGFSSFWPFDSAPPIKKSRARNALEPVAECEHTHSLI